jgi:hypothetical protein
MNAIRGQKLSGDTFDLARQRGDVRLYDGTRVGDSKGFALFLLQSAAIVGLAAGFSMLPVTFVNDGHGLLAQALAEDNDGGGSEGGEDGGGEDGGGEDGGGEDGGGEDGGGEDGAGGEDGGAGEDGGEDGAGGENGAGSEDGGAGEDGGEDGNRAGGGDENEGGEGAEDEGGEEADQESEDGEGATVIVPPPTKGW